MITETAYYLTKEGLERIKKEHEHLVEFKKAKTRGEVPSVLHSEEINPEYLAFQEDLTLLEVRLTEYESILKNVELIVPPAKGKRAEVCLGATVTLEESEGVINEYTLLGTLEANPGEGKISSSSPVGQVLLGKKVGEEVVINSPIRVVYRIKRIRYLPR